MWDWYMDGLGLHEVEILWSGGEQLELDLVDLGVEEVGWREDQVLRAVKNVVRALTTLYDHKDKNERQQKDNRYHQAVGIATCKHMITPEEQQDLDSRRPEGWLWLLGKMGGFLRVKWRNGQTKVQWFCAEAEMQRWKEQKEQKLVELLWTIRSYVKMQSVWSQLGDSHANQPGHAAYARQKAWMYERRVEDTRNLVRLGSDLALWLNVIDSMALFNPVHHRSITIPSLTRLNQFKPSSLRRCPAFKPSEKARSKFSFCLDILESAHFPSLTSEEK
ncbi:hypothetical protein DFH09DRAFT_1097622 [Mycena vulgaris]|nr:hypothetical protein DFH09DRAFT_1097622 [Mycena vulgaris]